MTPYDDKALEAAATAFNDKTYDLGFAGMVRSVLKPCLEAALTAYHSQREEAGMVEAPREPTIAYINWIEEERAKINRMEFLPLARRLGVPEDLAREFLLMGLYNTDFFTGCFYNEIQAAQGGKGGGGREGKKP